MAYKWVQNKQCYVGLNTDLKPIKVDIGAILYEFNLNGDIRKKYQTPDGGNTWTEIGNDSIGSVSLEAGNEIIGKFGIDQTTPGTTNKVVAELSGSILAEQKTQADAVANVITFTGDINAIEIYHESATWQDFIVNGITLKIPSGGYRTPIVGTVAKTVTIPAGVNCIVGRLS
ncbi:MAG: hypothetical protein PHH31_08655 [Acidaminococcaceae bacterium]|nr:hypothetical protein [Acidaminococcaceae bacterium]